jgi:hypothetical protein
VEQVVDNWTAEEVVGEVFCVPAELPFVLSYLRLPRRRENKVVASAGPVVDGLVVKNIVLTLMQMGVRRVAAPDQWVAVHDDAMAVQQNISGVVQTLVDVAVAFVAGLLLRSIVYDVVLPAGIVTV